MESFNFERKDRAAFRQDALNTKLSDETQSRTWSHSLEAFDFSQLVKKPTRVTPHSATLIDHVYTNQPDKITECIVSKIALSDHYPVRLPRHTSQLQTKKRNHNSIKYRSFTIFDNSTFLENLNTESENFKCTQFNSNMNFLTWNALFLSVLNKHAPIKEKRVKRAKKSEWLTEEITAAQKNRD